MFIEIDKRNSDKFDVSHGNCLIDFWAPTCPKCIRLKEKLIPELENHYGDTLKILLVNCSRVKKFNQEYKILSLPAFVIVKDGEVVKKIIGSNCNSENIFNELKEAFGF